MAIQDPDEVLIDRDEGCTTLSGGLLISIWVSRLHDDHPNPKPQTPNPKPQTPNP
jgi:hypothetical protein